METDDSLRAALRGAVPEPPPVATAVRVTGAQRRAARQRARVAVAGVGAAVGVATAVLAVTASSAPGPTVVASGSATPSPAAMPSGAVRDPLTAPVRPASLITAPPLPARAEGGALAVVPWTLLARSDDGRAFLVRVPVARCGAFERFDVVERAEYVLVTPFLRMPGAKAVCLNNRPATEEITYVVRLTEPLGDRPLLHAPVS